MERLPVIHKTKLSKEQTYFVNADQLSNILSDCRCVGDLSLSFSDDPSAVKSNYDRFVKQARKLVVLSARFTPWGDEASDPPPPARYSVTVYAMMRSVREDLIADFNDSHFKTLKDWLNEKRDATWQKKSHTLTFLIGINDEEISVAENINFDDYARGGKEDGHPGRRPTMKRH